MSNTCIVSVCWYMSWATKRLWKSTRQCKFGLFTESRYAQFGYITLVYTHRRELMNVVDNDLKWSLPYMMKVIKLGSLWMTLARLYNCYLIVLWSVCDYFHIMYYTIVVIPIFQSIPHSFDEGFPPRFGSWKLLHQLANHLC